MKCAKILFYMHIGLGGRILVDIKGEALWTKWTFDHCNSSWLNFYRHL
jgi:hypothetical protein